MEKKERKQKRLERKKHRKAQREKRWEIWKSPLKSLCDNGDHSFKLWLWGTVVFGLIGPIAGIIHELSQSLCVCSIFTALKAEASHGVFYIFSIVIVAGTFCPLLTKYLSKKDYRYENISLYVIEVIFYLIIITLVYAFFEPETVCGVDWVQLLVFVSALWCSIYSYAITLYESEDVGKKYMQGQRNDSQNNFQRASELNSDGEDSL